jgi:hypothetical protein
MLIKLICAANLLFAVVSTAHAQRVPRNFAELSAGAATEESEYDVRSTFGLTAGFAVGRLVASQLAAEARVSMSRFPAPQQITPPGFCRAQMPCIYPSVSDVGITTIALGGEYTFAPAADQSARALILAGAGARYVSEHPYRGSDTRPFAELGAGITFAHWGIRARYQRSTPGPDLPKWVLPLTLDFRF